MIEHNTDKNKPLFDKGKPELPRTIVYIDGFNFYHGSIKGTQHKWLNVQRYFELLRNADNVIQVYYFTARVHGLPYQRQNPYLRALATLPKVSVIEGRYKTKRVRCRVSSCTHASERRFTTWEEKLTDVNIAVQMMDDAYQDACDIFVVVSGDSDLVPPIYRIKDRFPNKKTVVYVPARDPSRGAATEIRKAADKDATLPQGLLRHAKLPPQVPDGAGRYIGKPKEW